MEVGGRQEGDEPRLQIHDRVCACLLLSLDLCTLRARNGRPTYAVYNYPVEQAVGTMVRTHISQCS